MKTIKVKEFEVPVGIIAEVADILASNELSNQITGTDDEHEFVFLEVNFEKGDEGHTAALHEIEDAIEDYGEDNENEEEDDENDD